MSTARSAVRVLPARLPGPQVGIGIALLSAPLAWFANVCVGYALASAPCYQSGPQVLAAAPHLNLSTAGLHTLLVVSTLASLLAAIYCLRTFHRTRTLSDQGEGADDRARTNFLALWGLIAGIGYAAATLMSIVAYVLLPPCGV